MRRLGLALAVLCAGSLGVLEGAAAETIRGTSRADALVGSDARDRVLGRAGHDRITVQSDGSVDTVVCGRGRDIVNADLDDRVGADCEVVSRSLSRDPYRNPDSQHETQVEPDSFAFGSTIVTAFQSGRRFEGAAANIGWATSRDGGRTWRSGFLPSTTIFSTPTGTAERISDPAVAYDAAHRVWLISTLAPSQSVTELYVHRSPDGLVWSAPIAAARAETRDLAYDKNWIACDNSATSRFRGRCYLSYTDHQQRRPRLATQFSDDGGLTWSPAALLTVDNVGVMPVVRPDGTLVIAYLDSGPDAAMFSVLSRDGGASYTAPALISRVQAAAVPGVRAFPLPTAEVDGTGTIYVAWQDCRFQPECRANDIVLARSGDGVGWSRPTRIPTAPVRDALNSFVPGLGVDRASSLPRTRLALVYHWTPTRTCARSCAIDVGMITSANGGATWGPSQRLTARSIPQDWIANTRTGRMTGDYLSTSFVAGAAVPVFSIAAEPRGSRLRQSIAALEPRPVPARRAGR